MSTKPGPRDAREAVIMVVVYVARIEAIINVV